MASPKSNGSHVVMEVDTNEENKSKRKGSSLSKENPKKLLTQGPGKTGGLQRQSSYPNIPNPLMSKVKSLKVAFSDMVKMTLGDQNFAKSMAPVL